MIYDTVIGIDPGKSNGYIAIYRNGKIGIVKMHTNIIEFRKFIQHYKSISKRLIVYIEHIEFHNMMDPRIVRRLKVLTDHYAELISILKIEFINYRKVHPRTWQKSYGLIMKKTETAVKKKIHREFLCTTLQFPKVAIKKADAILILKYGLSQISNNIDLGNTLIMKSC